MKIEHLLDYCLSNSISFLLIGGNGGSGKSSLARQLIEELKARGLQSNCIDMDDFVVDTSLRKSSVISRNTGTGERKQGYCTTSCKEAYFLPAIETMLASLMQGKECLYKKKHVADYITLQPGCLTIIEGVGTAFLEPLPRAVGVFLTCDVEIEIQRRITRNRNGEAALNEDEIRAGVELRREQFDVFVVPQKMKYDCELVSDKSGDAVVERDALSVW